MHLFQIPKSPGVRNGDVSLWVNVLSTKVNKLSSIPGTNIMEEENQLLASYPRTSTYFL